LHRVDIFASKNGLEVLCETRVFDADVDAIEIDERIEGIDASEPLGRVVAMCNELCDPVVDCVVENLELLGAKVSMADSYKLAKLHGGSFSQIIACSMGILDPFGLPTVTW
jgi:hypothetical protein